MSGAATDRPHDATALGGGANHVSDDALVAALDGELDAAACSAFDAHLARCERCRARERTLRADAALVAAALAGDGVDALAPAFGWDDVRHRAADAPRLAVWGTAHLPAGRPVGRLGYPPAYGRTVWRAVPWRTAAGLGLSAGIAAAAPWALRWARARPTAAAPSARAPERHPGATPDTGARVTGVATFVRFPLRGDTLRVAFDAAQPSGALQLVVGGAGQADVTVDVRGGAEAARVLVLPDGVRVGSTPSATVQYRVTLPTSVRAVRVAVGVRQLAPISGARVAAAAAGIRVPLSAAP